MTTKRGCASVFFSAVIVFIIAFFVPIGDSWGNDLPDIQARGVIRHLGVPYANFVTGSGDGLDVEMMKLFARSLGVRYEYVPTVWRKVIGDLTGKQVVFDGKELKIMGDVPVTGDIIANGMTMIPWRREILNFSRPTFQTQIWLVALADSPLAPIMPSGDIEKDILAVKGLLRGYTCLGLPDTCLEPALYGIKETGARPVMFDGHLNEIAPALFKRAADVALMDLPDAVIAIEKWPGRLKVIGPLSPVQHMAIAFSKTSPLLEEAFEQFLNRCWSDGTYLRLVKKYYPVVPALFPGFF
ncbi:transporter substrate-binding domain-containing protein [Desulfococcus sp.]|uniref:transporter substrate-binding domain-containing protein n=1 Tax=Desulfococcus sp. TaxID=2025834 RepID=UPI003593730D